MQSFDCKLQISKMVGIVSVKASASSLDFNQNKPRNASVMLIGSACQHIIGKTQLTSVSISSDEGLTEMDALSSQRTHVTDQRASIATNTAGILPLTAAAVRSVKVNCQTSSKLSRLSILPDQHGIPDSGNLFCKMLRTS